MGKERGSLSGRLAAIRELQEKGGGKIVRPEEHAPLRPDLPGSWEKIGEYTYRLETVYPAPYQPSSTDPLLEQREQQKQQAGPPAVPPGAPRVVFFDLETTGLSGGVGNVVFLAGFGRVEGDELTTEQYFLADFPGENEFLQLICERLCEEAVYVSYNGKSFDSRLLESKFLMHRIDFRFVHQVDLLHHSRRLWKNRIGACSLGNIEEQVLGLSRKLDVPGFMVPDLYFSYLNTGKTGQLAAVFEHNRQDIVSLVHLYGKINGILTEPKNSGDIDGRSLGNYLAARGDDNGEKLLASCFEAGDHRSGKNLSLLLKRQGRWEEAVVVWEAMWKDGASLFAGVELAKYFEHRVKEPDRALPIVDTLLEKYAVMRDVRSELKRRKQRLERKIERKIHRIS